jgi:hypothetical protein
MESRPILTYRGLVVRGVYTSILYSEFHLSSIEGVCKVQACDLVLNSGTNSIFRAPIISTACHVNALHRLKI